MMSADHQVRSLFDVISFILESLSSSEAQAFETEIFSEYFRKHLNLLEKKNRDFQDSCSIPKTKELNEKDAILFQDSQSSMHRSPVDKADLLNNVQPMIIAENSLNDKFFEQDNHDQTESPDFLPPTPIRLFEERDKTSKDLPLTGKVIVFDPFAENTDLDEYEKEHENIDEVRAEEGDLGEEVHLLVKVGLQLRGRNALSTDRTAIQTS